MAILRGWRIAASATLFFVSGADASGLRVTPLRLDLGPDMPATQIELLNLNPGPLAVQVKAYTWHQTGTDDVYEPTKDVFFAPPIVTVPKAGKTTIRFRLRAPAGAAERAYRVYFQELPPADAAQSSGMTFRLRFGVPLFVAAAGEAHPALKPAAAVQDRRLRVTLDNPGNAHLKIEGLEVYPAGVDRDKVGQAPVASATHSTMGSNYLLPGTTHDWLLDLPAKFDPAKHVLLIRTDDYSGSAAAGMTPRGWLWLPLAAAGAAPGKP